VWWLHARSVTPPRRGDEVTWWSLVKSLPCSSLPYRLLVSSSLDAWHCHNLDARFKILEYALVPITIVDDSSFWNLNLQPSMRRRTPNTRSMVAL
jgi:hypothetical protein